MPAVLNLLQDYASTPGLLLKNLIWRRPSTVSDKQVVFVVGCPRSGTTLLHRILSIHSDVFSLPHETAFVSHLNIFTRNTFDLPDHLNQAYFKECRDLIDYFDCCIAYHQDQSSGTHFVEKTPQHVLHIPFLLKHFSQAKIIHIYRDGRDCFASARSHPFIPQKRSAEVFANYWKKCIHKGRSDLTSGRVYQLKYEDFVSAPKQQLEAVLAQIGLTYQPAQLDTSQISNDARSERSVFQKLQKPIDNSSCGRWHEDLSDAEKAQFTKIAGDELSELGYEA